MEKTVRITCKGADVLPIKVLTSFQGNLKTLAEKEYKKLKTSIEKHGFSFPVFIWKSGKTNFIIDGHQRLLVLQKMVEEGWKIEGDMVPVDWIEAKTKQEAKEKVLISASQYGRIDIESLYEFVEMEGLDFKDLQLTVDLPSIDIAKVFGPIDDVDQRPEFPELVDRFDAKKEATENGNWFFVEYYENDDQFSEIVNLLEPHLIGSKKHEVDKEIFYKMVQSYFGNKHEAK